MYLGEKDNMYKETLSIKNLQVSVMEKDKNLLPIVKGIDLKVTRGRITALVGESGCGKSTASLALIGLLPKNMKVKWDSYNINEAVVEALSYNQWRKIRGSKVAMVFQDSIGSLDPVFTVENQIVEAILAHEKVSKQEAYNMAVNLLLRFKFQNPEHIMKSYPFQLSGGMCQRIMIAMTILMKPEFLIADEPTTALDVTIQAEILREIYNLSRKENMGVLFITHDLGVVAEIADDVCIMKDGVILETGSTEDIFHNAACEYTRNLVASFI